MSKLTNELESLIVSVPKDFITLENPNFKLNPSKWSKKEIIGHLCDSATMNHKRFIERLISNDDIALELYQQNHWVELNDYQNSYSVEEVLTLWTSLNKRIVKTIQNTSEEQLQRQYLIKDEKVTLEWLFTDYVEHLKHHLKQIFDQK